MKNITTLSSKDCSLTWYSKIALSPSVNKYQKAALILTVVNIRASVMMEAKSQPSASVFEGMFFGRAAM